MINELIIVIITVCFLVFVLSFLLYFITKKTNVLMKNKFIDNASELDVLIADKEKMLDDLNKDIENKEKVIKNLEGKENGLLQSGVLSNEVSLPKNVDFDDGNLLHNYKLIREKFNFNTRKVVMDFVSQTKKFDDTSYNFYKKVRSYFTTSIVYKIVSYSKEEQYVIIENLLQDNEKQVLKKFSKKNFNLRRFLDYLDKMIIKSDPCIKVLVGKKNISYNDIDKNVDTIYDETIIEGFKIIYRGIVYDYSL